MNIEQLAESLPRIEKWIDHLVLEAAPKARSTDSFGFRRLNAWYATDLLQATKVVPVSKVPVPPLSEWGLPGFTELEQMDGITYGDIYFLLSDRQNDETLHFHELVHVLQWKLLGRRKFIVSYVLGHGVEGGYESNPFEVMAYQFQAAFEAGRCFDVNAAVAKESKAIYAKLSAVIGRDGIMSFGVK